MYEHADQRAADLRREANALRLAAGERGRRTCEREVIQADVGQEPEPRADLLDDLMRDLLLPLRQRQARGRTPRARSIDMRVSSSMLRPPTVTASASGLRRAPLQAGQTEADMNFSISSLTYSLDVSPYRRCRLLTTPSNDDAILPRLTAARGVGKRLLAIGSVEDDVERPRRRAARRACVVFTR